MESESQKKSYCIMEDIYGAMMVPKEELQLQLQLRPLSRKKPPPFHLELRVPDLGRALQVILLLHFFPLLFIFIIFMFLPLLPPSFLFNYPFRFCLPTCLVVHFFKLPFLAFHYLKGIFWNFTHYF